MIIDSHCHILPPGFADRRAGLLTIDTTFAALFSREGSPMATAESLIDAMDRDGVDRAVVMGMGWTDRELAAEVNDYISDSVARHPGRLTGFCSVNPAWGDWAAAEIERCTRAGHRGVGELHPDTQGFDVTDKRVMAPVMDIAKRLGLPVLVHSSEPVGHQYLGKGDTTPGKLYRFIQNFPESTIVCAHWGGGLPFYSLMPEVPEVMRNVYYDTAASPFLYRPEVVATVAGILGADKVLFATDYPLIQPRRMLKQIEHSGLDRSSKEAILGGNAARLLAL